MKKYLKILSLILATSSILNTYLAFCAQEGFRTLQDDDLVATHLRDQAHFYYPGLGNLTLVVSDWLKKDYLFAISKRKEIYLPRANYEEMKKYIKNKNDSEEMPSSIPASFHEINHIRSYDHLRGRVNYSEESKQFTWFFIPFYLGYRGIVHVLDQRLTHPATYSNLSTLFTTCVAGYGVYRRYNWLKQSRITEQMADDNIPNNLKFLESCQRSYEKMGKTHLIYYPHPDRIHPTNQHRGEMYKQRYNQLASALKLHYIDNLNPEDLPKIDGTSPRKAAKILGLPEHSYLNHIDDLKDNLDMLKNKPSL